MNLLAPRFKVIADYPGCTFAIGRILTQRDGNSFFASYDGKNQLSSETVMNPAKYQHLFRKLEWWEDRNKEDFPGYVKNNCKGAALFGEILKVHNRLVLSRKFIFKDEFGYTSELHYKDTLPATEAEYNEWRGKQK